MFGNIEKLIEFGYEMIVAKVRYGTRFYVAFDSDDLTYKPFAELLEGIGGFDDLAVEYMHALEKIESKYPDYPVAWAESLEKGFTKIEEKAGNWLKDYNFYEHGRVLKDIEVTVKELAEHWI